MGIAGACANYFSDELKSALILFFRNLPTCADGQDIGSVAVELAQADARDPRQFVLVVGGGLGDRHEGLVREDAEGRLAAALRLYGTPVAQPLIEPLVHVGGTVLATHELHLARVGERAPAHPAARRGALGASRGGADGAREAALDTSGTATRRPARGGGGAGAQSVEEAAGAAVGAAAGGAGERPGDVKALTGAGDTDIEEPALLLDL